MIDHFRRGVRDLESIWQTMFDRADMEQLQRAAARTGPGFAIDDGLWAHLVYALAAAYHRRVSERDALVRSTLPLYMGRVASFVTEMADADARRVGQLEQLCRSRAGKTICAGDGRGN
jgi:hypothetical protein